MRAWRVAGDVAAARLLLRRPGAPADACFLLHHALQRRGAPAPRPPVAPEPLTPNPRTDLPEPGTVPATTDAYPATTPYQPAYNPTTPGTVPYTPGTGAYPGGLDMAHPGTAPPRRGHPRQRASDRGGADAGRKPVWRPGHRRRRHCGARHRDDTRHGVLHARRDDCGDAGVGTGRHRRRRGRAVVPPTTSAHRCRSPPRCASARLCFPWSGTAAMPALERVVLLCCAGAPLVAAPVGVCMDLGSARRRCDTAAEPPARARCSGAPARGRSRAGTPLEVTPVFR